LLVVAVVKTAPVRHAYPPHVRKSRSSREQLANFNEKEFSPDEAGRDPFAECSAIRNRSKLALTAGWIGASAPFDAYRSSAPFDTLHRQLIGAD